MFHYFLRGFLATLAVSVFAFGSYTLSLPSHQLVADGSYVGKVDVSGMTLADAREAVEAMHDEKNIAVFAGNAVQKFSYSDLGVQINVENVLGQLNLTRHFGLAVLLTDPETNVVYPEININAEILKRTILKAFPFLTDIEQAQSSFFAVPGQRLTATTFNVEKLGKEVASSSRHLGQASVTMQLLPLRPRIVEARAVTPVIQAIQEEKVVESEVQSKDILSDLPERVVPRITDQQRQEMREVLSTQEIVLRVHDKNLDLGELEWRIKLSEEFWLIDTVDGVGVNMVMLESYLKNNVAPDVERKVQHAFIKSYNPDEGVAQHADVEGVARDGVELPIGMNMEKLRQDLGSGVFDAGLILKTVPSFVYNDTGIDLGQLEEVGFGRSNFAGSPNGRAFNIGKGLDEKMNNIIVPPGASFNFNGFLGPVTYSRGWQASLGIFGGGTLRKTPGGGLCQVSTTVYRAALNAGLPILSRRPHSLYVHYYKEYGEGLDATIFMGGPNLIFQNDTPSYLMVQAYVDGDDAYVKVYGTDDGREVTLDGPYRRHNIPGEKNYNPTNNEIVWFREIRKSDGSLEEETISSRYKTLPR